MSRTLPTTRRRRKGPVRVAREPCPHRGVATVTTNRFCCSVPTSTGATRPVRPGSTSPRQGDGADQPQLPPAPSESSMTKIHRMIVIPKDVQHRCCGELRTAPQSVPSSSRVPRPHASKWRRASPGGWSQQRGERAQRATAGAARSSVTSPGAFSQREGFHFDAVSVRRRCHYLPSCGAGGR